MKNKRVEELVEDRARLLYNFMGNPHLDWYSCRVTNKYRYVAKQILSHPDLALIDREVKDIENPFKPLSSTTADGNLYIPLGRIKEDNSLTCYVDMDQAEAYDLGKTDLLSQGYKSVIPLAKALEEEDD